MRRLIAVLFPLELTFKLFLISSLLADVLKSSPDLDCSSSQLFSLASQNCVDCSGKCSTCYGLGADDCFTCNTKPQYFQNQSDFSCSENCPKGTYADLLTSTCLECGIVGCSVCSGITTCETCFEGLTLSSDKSSCLSECSEQDYNFQANKSTQQYCVSSCNVGYSTNSSDGFGICEEIPYCPSIQEQSALQNPSVINLVRTLSNGMIIVLKEMCTFVIYNTDLLAVYSKTLIPEESYLKFNQLYIQYQGYIIDNIGYCYLQDQQVIAYDFIKNKQISYVTRTFKGLYLLSFHPSKLQFFLSDYFVLYLYDILSDQLVFLASDENGFMQFEALDTFSTPTFFWLNYVDIYVLFLDDNLQLVSQINLGLDSIPSLTLRVAQPGSSILFCAETMNNSEIFFLLEYSFKSFTIIEELPLDDINDWKYSYDLNAIIIMPFSDSTMLIYSLNSNLKTFTQKDSWTNELPNNVSIIGFYKDFLILKVASDTYFFGKLQKAQSTDISDNSLTFVKYSEMVFLNKALNSQIIAQDPLESDFLIIIFLNYENNVLLKQRYSKILDESSSSQINENSRCSCGQFQPISISKTSMQIFTSSASRFYSLTVDNKYLNFMTLLSTPGVLLRRVQQNTIQDSNIQQSIFHYYFFSASAQTKFFLQSLEYDSLQHYQLCQNIDSACVTVLSSKQQASVGIPAKNYIYLCVLGKLIHFSDQSQAAWFSLAITHSLSKCYSLSDNVFLILNSNSIIKVDVTQQSITYMITKSSLSLSILLVNSLDNLWMSLDGSTIYVQVTSKSTVYSLNLSASPTSLALLSKIDSLSSLAFAKNSTTQIVGFRSKFAYYFNSNFSLLQTIYLPSDTLYQRALLQPTADCVLIAYISFVIKFNISTGTYLSQAPISTADVFELSIINSNYFQFFNYIYELSTFQMIASVPLSVAIFQFQNPQALLIPSNLSGLTIMKSTREYYVITNLFNQKQFSKSLPAFSLSFIGQLDDKILFKSDSNNALYSYNIFSQSFLACSAQTVDTLLAVDMKHNLSFLTNISINSLYLQSICQTDQSANTILQMFTLDSSIVQSAVCASSSVFIYLTSRNQITILNVQILPFYIQNTSFNYPFFKKHTQVFNQVLHNAEPSPNRLSQIKHNRYTYLEIPSLLQ